MNCLKTFIIILLAYFQSGCTKSVETLEGSDVFTYFPVAIGNAITYSLDSTRYIQVGAEKEIRSYIIKDSVETLTNETAKSKTYRIARLVRNEFDSTLWTRLSTYYITIDSSRLELMESNKKYL